MKSPLHNCAAKGCFQLVPRHMLMCSAHWALVPTAAQREVYAAWTGLQRTGSFAASDRHHDAVQTAVNAVAAKQEEVARKRGGGTAALF